MKACRGEKGFSLVELLVAMFITVIVSGAIFGLMTAGQTAFRKEPARTDQQQNARAAMDMIQRDVAGAGAQLTQWVQAFTRGDGINETAPLLNGRGPNGSDFLQIYGNDGACPAVPVDPLATASGGVNGTNVFTGERFPDCYDLPSIVAVVSPTEYYIALAEWPGPGQTGPSADHVNFPPGQQPASIRRCTPGGGCPPSDAEFLTPVQVVRYEIAADPTDGILGLWRSNTGGVDLGTRDYSPAPGAQCTPVPGDADTPPTCPTARRGNWQLIARGIENLQVDYLMADGTGGAPPGSPAIVASPTYGNLVRQATVTLTSRTIEEGANRVVGAVDLRSTLTSVVTPRTVLATLSDPAAAGLQWQ